MFSLLVVIALVFGGSKSAQIVNESRDVHVVLLAGQSNMAGAGNFDVLDASEIERIENVSHRVTLSFNGKPAQPLSYYKNNPTEKYNFTKRFGPEIFIGLTLAENNPNQEYLLIKRSQGGTALYGAWNPNWTAEKARKVEKPKKQNIQLFDRHIEDIATNLKALQSQGKTYKIIGMAWMQGENDAAKEVSAKTYEANLKVLIKSYRDRLDVENMPFVIGQINSRYGKFKKEGPAMVRKAMEDVANADAYVSIIKTTTDSSWRDYPKHTDNVHYNAEGQRRLGKAFGKKLITKSGLVNRPNLIIIHTDEHNFRTLSCYQKLLSEDQAFVWGKANNSKTPYIDRIADEGAIATSYYASSPVCTPSRASLVTGLYPQATGAPKNGLHLSDNVPTFATILSDQGYATSYVGKWHLAGHEKYTFDIKYKAGFADNRYMMRGGHAPYYHVTGANFKGINERNAAKLSKDEVIHATDFFTDKTLEILERDKDQPFAIMLSIPDPHTPDVAKPPYNTMYEDMTFESPKTMAPEYVAVKPSWATDTGKNETIGKKSFENDNEALKQYFGMVSHIDDSVGRILKFLDDNKLTENTIIIFTSDHGDMFFEHNRRNKGVPYEASARIPFIIRYPDKIPAGKVINTAYTNVDFAPTILSLMNVKTDTKFHGLDTAEDFLSKENVVNSDRITYYAKSGGWWVTAVNDRYKLVIDKKEKPYLFDLEKDPDELINFYYEKEYYDIAKMMQTELFRQLKKYDEPGLKNKQPYVME